MERAESRNARRHARRERAEHTGRAPRRQAAHVVPLRESAQQKTRHGSYRFDRTKTRDALRLCRRADAAARPSETM